MFFGIFVLNRVSNLSFFVLGPLHMSPVDRAGPVSEISPHL